MEPMDIIRVVLIDVAGTTVEEGLSLIDPRLPGQPNWIEGPPSPERPNAKFFFEGETRNDGTLIFRERPDNPHQTLS